MKKIVCEACGGTDLVKEGDFFVCQNCGVKYTVADVQKIIFDGPIEVKGKVQIDKNYKAILDLADEAYKIGDYSGAYKYYTQYVEQYPDDYEIRFKRALAYGNIDYMEKEHVEMSVNFVSTYCDMILQNESLSKEEKSNQIHWAFVNIFIILNNVYGTIPEYIKSDDDYDFLLDVVEYYVAKSESIYQLLEKYLPYSPRLDELWEVGCENIDSALKVYNEEYEVGQSILFLSAEGKRRYRQLLKENEKNKQLLAVIKQKMKNDQYWQEHQEEKDNLLEKKQAYADEIKEIEETIKTLKDDSRSIAERNAFDPSSYDNKIESLNNEIDNLNNQLRSLGLFDAKGKKPIKDNIALIKKQIKFISEEKALMQNKQNDRIKELIDNNLNKILNLQHRIDDINIKIKEVDKTLNMPR